jgi:hypothetical protein
MSKVHEALVFVDIHTIIDAKGLKAVHVRVTGHEKTDKCDAFSSG